MARQGAVILDVGLLGKKVVVSRVWEVLPRWRCLPVQET